MTHDPTLANGPEQGAPVPPRWCASCGARWATGMPQPDQHRAGCKAYLVPHVDPWAILEQLPAVRAQLDSYLRGTGATPIRDDHDNHVAVVPPEFNSGPDGRELADQIARVDDFHGLHARAALQIEREQFARRRLEEVVAVERDALEHLQRGDGYGLNITVGDDAPTLENLLDLADEHIAHIRDVAGRLEEVVAAQREALERLHDALAAFRP